ncbi:MAG: carbon-nitrogen hydrolase family protein [Candidatus Heimdallarchaeota archaeon]
MKISIGQMEIGNDLETNLENARRLIEIAATRGSRLVCLPEYFALPPFTDMDLATIYEETYDTTIAMLQEVSRVNRVCLIGGSLIRKRHDGLYFNSCPVYDQGVRIALQDKIHITTRERAWGLSGGERLQVFEVDGVKVGVTICADILFPKTIATLRDQKAKLLAVPLTSPVRENDQTRKNRDCIFIARAFDNNVYVIKTGSVGRTASGVKVAGRSLIAAPHGILMKAKSETEEEVLTVDLDIAKLRAMDLIAELFE